MSLYYKYIVFIDSMQKSEGKLLKVAQLLGNKTKANSLETTVLPILLCCAL